MVSVLMVAGAVPQQEAVLVEALRRFREQGVRVRLVCNFSLDLLTLEPGLVEAHSLGDTPAPGDPSRALWLRAKRDRVVRAWMRGVDVLVSLDVLAVYTVWEMAQRHLRADACQGLGPATRAVQARLDGTRRGRLSLGTALGARAGVVARGTRRGAVTAARKSVSASMSTPVMRTGVGAAFWQTVAASPGLPDRIRVGLTHQVHVRLVQADRPQQAAATTARAIARLKDRQARIDLLAREAKSELAKGRIPIGLRETVTAQLELADTFLTKKNPHRATQFGYQAIRLLFNRVPQLDQATSPLLDPAGDYLTPLRDSAVGRALATPRGRAVPAATPPGDRALRLLLVTRSEEQDADVDEIRRRYGTLPEVELRHLRLSDEATTEKLARNAPGMVEHKLSGEATSYGNRVAEWLAPHLRWADTVLVDSCPAAALVTLTDPGDTRIVVRVHDVDVVDFWGQLVDFSRVDDVVFVSAHLRDLAISAVPTLTGDRVPTTHVLPHAMDLRAFARPKVPDARFTLGVIGSDTPDKDAYWAIEVLRLLRAQDPRYRLLLVGAEPEALTGAVYRRHLEDLTRQVAALAPAVSHRAGVADVAEVLGEVGVVLSSSTRETFHRALVEGTATGAVPVVRDWPFFAGFPHGARDLFPAEWLVETPRQAADRILATTGDAATWSAAGTAASAHALATWDWSVVQQRYDELLRVPVVDPVG
ncbi:glycosyltransferase [Micromonospora sp. NPDC050187]|uniref:glycosyltransferase n=1 Tax=Micromonospora sp. NPDC050187 TaxID=3364277 RepID=UPI00379016BB